MDETKQPRSEREIDLESLKVLAHPLRVKIIDVLSTYGPFTASGLAERLGESSGATSYHLRQLGRHDFVREVEGRGTGRERWWERTPGGFTLTPDVGTSPAGKAAGQLVMREWANQRDSAMRAFIENGPTVLSSEWVEASTLALSNVHPTAAQLGEFTHAFMALLDDFLDKYRDQRIPGSRPVQIHFNAFPVIDGIEINAPSNVGGTA